SRSGGPSARGHCRGQRGTRKTAVAADDQRVAPTLERERSKRLRDYAHDLRRQRAADDAADVVRLEDFGGKGGESHGRSRVIERTNQAERIRPLPRSTANAPRLRSQAQEL